MDGKVLGKRGEQVALTSPCPASRSLGLCAPIKAPGDSSAQRRVRAPALAEGSPQVEIGWLEQGVAKKGFKNQMRGCMRQCFPNVSDSGTHQGGCSGGRILVYWLKTRFPAPLISISREEAWEADF